MFGGTEFQFSDALTYLALGLIVLWTARLARVKRRNPYIWGGAALLLIVVTETMTDNVLGIVGMVPMVALLFLKPPPTAASAPAPETVTCPKCHAYHAAGHSFCVNCGWELSRPYMEEPHREDSHRAGDSPASAVADPPSRDAAMTLDPAVEPQAQAPGTEPLPVDEPPIAEAEPEPAEPVSPESVPAYSPEIREPAGDAAPGEPQEAEASPAYADPVAPERVVPERAPVSAPPVFRRPITAAGFTNLGLELSAAGKFQEAVDQFSKAIALDARHSPAWAGRAEAYKGLGLDRKADEDRQQLDSIQPTPPA